MNSTDPPSSSICPTRDVLLSPPFLTVLALLLLLCSATAYLLRRLGRSRRRTTSFQQMLRTQITKTECVPTSSHIRDLTP